MSLSLFPPSVFLSVSLGHCVLTLQEEREEGGLLDLLKQAKQN